MPGQRKKTPVTREAASRVEPAAVTLHLEVESIRRLARSSGRTRGEDEVWEELVDNAEAPLLMLELVHPENGRIRYELPVRKTLPVHVGMRVRLSLTVDASNWGFIMASKGKTMQPDPSYEYREVKCSTYAQVEAQRLGGPLEETP